MTYLMCPTVRFACSQSILLVVYWCVHYVSPVKYWLIWLRIRAGAAGGQAGADGSEWKHECHHYCITEPGSLWYLYVRSDTGPCAHTASKTFTQIPYVKSKVTAHQLHWEFCTPSVWTSISDDSAAPLALTKYFSVPLSPPVPSSPVPPPLTSVGPGLCGCLTPTDKGEGVDWGGLHTCVRWECWLASADATQASAVSSHRLIPLPRSPCDPEVLGSLLWPGTFGMDGEGGTEAPAHRPASATSSLWHNRKTHTHTHTLRHSAQHQRLPTHT